MKFSADTSRPKLISDLDPDLDSDLDSGTESYLNTDLLCFSHLRWHFVLQRPQHLLSRFARHRRVFFFEEPVFQNIGEPKLKLEMSPEGVHIATPLLPLDTSEKDTLQSQAALIDELVAKWEITQPTLWFYSPLALKFASHLQSALTIYDCMDELSLFKNAPRDLVPLERKLLKKADVVFTGGQSLFEAKRHLHKNIYPFPSAIDSEHFHRARGSSGKSGEALDQRELPGPKIGFYGVLDERLDLELLAGLADERPSWQIVMIGPLAKITTEDLPKRPNIHYLGKREYADLPSYLAGWDAAILPFARNDSTRFISPTKTPEYLAAGCPVVSTSIRDVIRPYKELGLVEIADTPKTFATAIERVVRQAKVSGEWLRNVDRYLAKISWDQTLLKMAELEQAASEQKMITGGYEFLGTQRRFQEAVQNEKAAN